jgi:uncharacterized protein with HEPN domain
MTSGDNRSVSNDPPHEATMNRAEVLQKLASSKAELAHRYGVTRLAVFESVVRDSARPDSDVDILVSFDGPATSTRYFGVDQSAFVANALVFDATVRNLELIGEAATRVPHDVRQAHPHVPWRMIIATRNRLIHAYLGIDNDTLWSIVLSDVPARLPMLRAVRLHAPG